MRQALAARGVDAGRRGDARYRRLLDAARPGRARLLLPGRRPARHAHEPGGRERRRFPQRRRRGRDRRRALPLWRGAEVAPGRPGDRRGAADRADRPARRRRPQGARPSSGHEEGSGDADLPGDPHPRERGTGRARGRAGGGRAGARARRPPRRRHLPQPRGPDREALPQGAQRRAARRARVTCPAANEAGPAADLRGGRARPVRAGAAELDANPRARSATLARRAPHRRPAWAGQQKEPSR